MALDKMTGGAAGLNTVKPVETLRRPNEGAGIDSKAGVDFKRALEQFAPSAGIGGVGKSQAPAMGGAEKLKFSNHAIDRMRSRGISFQPEEMKSIESAVTKAAAKGSKDTLILSGDNALIVSVKDNTVVTVMDKAAMKDNVFTNIDSTVVI